MIAVIDYGAGNVANVQTALDHLGRRNCLLSAPGDGEADLYLLPGVGAFPPAMARLKERGWADFLRLRALSGTPLLGICLGMQLLCRESLEDGKTEGLGLIDGTITPLEGTARLPHMGWNGLRWRDEPLFPFRGDLYFVHSYGLLQSDDALAYTDVDGLSFVSLVRRGAVAGCQFHPERSGLEGVAFLGRLLDHLEKEGPR